MYKYRYFSLLLCVPAVLLLWVYLPVCFDNNDDQTMFVINSGMLTGIPSANSILSHVIIGKILAVLFTHQTTVNWYTIYIELTLLICFLLYSSFFIYHKRATPVLSLLLVSFLFFGFFSWTIVKPQFTTLALFLVGASLLLYAMPLSSRYKITGVVSLMVIAMLIRKDVWNIFVVFSVPILIRYRNIKSFRRVFAVSFISVSILFFCLQWINNNNNTYREQQTYRNVHALDIIAANPIKKDSDYCASNGFYIDDILLLQSWLVADDAYLSGKTIESVATHMKTTRDMTTFLSEWKKVILDERYLILLYVLSCIAVFAAASTQIAFSGMNFLTALLLFSFLLISLRLPHRVTFPILVYLILSNIFLLLESNGSYAKKIGVFSLMLLLGIYKFYCVVQLGPLHKSYQHYYDACRSEINHHPEALFVGAEAFPLESMNAWESPVNTFPAQNLVLAGWYPCSPDFKIIMSQLHLKNLSSALCNINKVFFITESKVLQDAYVEMMKKRYRVQCHFESAPEFKALKAKKLVFGY